MREELRRKACDRPILMLIQSGIWIHGIVLLVSRGIARGGSGSSGSISQTNFVSCMHNSSSDCLWWVLNWCSSALLWEGEECTPGNTLSKGGGLFELGGVWSRRNMVVLLVYDITSYLVAKNFDMFSLSQAVPFGNPRYPHWHRHSKDPGVLTHLALRSQWWLSHSLMSNKIKIETLHQHSIYAHLGNSISMHIRHHRMNSWKYHY